MRVQDILNGLKNDPFYVERLIPIALQLNLDEAEVYMGVKALFDEWNDNTFEPTQEDEMVPSGVLFLCAIFDTSIDGFEQHQQRLLERIVRVVFKTVTTQF